MDKISQVLGTVIGGTGPTLDYATLVAAGYVVPEFEEEATEDYLFDAANSTVLRSRVSGAALDLVGTAPTYAANYLTVAAGINGLRLAASDSVEHTLAIVFQRPASGPTGVLALIGSEDPVGSLGCGVYISSIGGFTFSVRPGTADPVISGAVGDVALPRSSWGFMAVGISAAGASLFLGQSSGSIVSNSAGAITHGLGARIGVGKVMAMGGSYDDAALSVHRAMHIPRRLSTTELESLYKRCQVVAARRGITVV